MALDQIPAPLANFRSPRLAALLAAELARGNGVLDEWRSWPVRGLCVCLRGRLSEVPPVAGLTYARLADPHHWFNEYVDDETQEMLVGDLRP